MYVVYQSVELGKTINVVKCRIAPSMHHLQFSTCVHVSRFVSSYISDES